MLTTKVEHFIGNVEQNFSNYRNLVKDLESSVYTYCELQGHQNPIGQRIEDLTANEVKWVIQEYSQFSNEAIHMLLDARIRVHEWTDLSEEIDRNIEEEKGSETKGVPHLEIMRMGYQIGLDFDVNNYNPSEITKTFLSLMKKIFRKKENAYVAGALLAFESISIPEFHILDALAKKYQVDRGIIRRNDYLRDYIDGHKVFEVGHKEGLMKAIEPYIWHHQSREFSAGYLAVCMTVSNWWGNLNEEITRKKLQNV